MSRVESAWRHARQALGVVTMLLAGAAVAGAQGSNASSANTGNIAVSGNIDLPSVYIFRGLVQESDPGITVMPSADVAIAVGKASVTLGTWHSLQSGSSGLDGPTGRLHYEERFLAGVRLPLAFGTSLTTTYTAYTAPGNIFETRQELNLRVASQQWLRPYGLAAVELKGAADGVVDGKGAYLELGVAPAFPLGVLRSTISVPTRVGLSLKNYYQGFDGDHRFGFFDVGGLVTVPIGGDGRYGRWNLHGGASLYVLGDTPKLTNEGKGTKIVGTVGLGFRY